MPSTRTLIATVLLIVSVVLLIRSRKQKRLRGMIASDRVVSTDEMNSAIRKKAAQTSKGERELLHGLNEYTAHADEVATPNQRELDPDTDPLKRLRGSVKRYDRPTDPVAEEDWNSKDLRPKNSE